VRLNRFVGAYDPGRIINPKTARSQAIGGIIWGVGQALLEQSETDPASGQFMNRNCSGYLVPTNADIRSSMSYSLAASMKKRARWEQKASAS
jgi:xanthine dehydrogenase YagR molybdenum-binding subunit